MTTTATISWVPDQKTYQITCLSKNGMVVSGCYHAKGGVGEGETQRICRAYRLLINSEIAF